MASTAAEALLIARIAPPPNDSAVRTSIFVRSGGDDTGPGTLANPLATVRELFRRLPRNINNEYINADITGVDEEISEDVTLVTPQSADSEQIDFNPSHRTWGIEYPFSLRATPTLIETLNTPTTTFTPGTTHGMFDVQDTSQSWTVDQHKDRWLVGAATAFGPGFIPPTPMPIISNTANTLVVAGSTTPNAPYEILEHGARLRFGAAPAGGIPFRFPFTIHGLGGFGCQWIRFGLSTAAAASTFQSVHVASTTPTLVSLADCRFDAGLRVGRGSSIDIDEGVFNGGFFAFEGADGTRNLRRGVFSSVNFSSHFGNFFGSDLRIRSCGPFPGTTTNYDGLMDLDGIEILNGTGDGLRIRGGLGQWRVKDAVISSCAGHAISLRATNLILDNVSGSGNTSAGLFIRDGAQCQVVGTVNVNLGATEVDAGGALGNQLWSAVPFAEHTGATSVRVFT